MEFGFNVSFLFRRISIAPQLFSSLLLADGLRTLKTKDRTMQAWILTDEIAGMDTGGLNRDGPTMTDRKLRTGFARYE